MKLVLEYFYEGDLALPIDYDSIEKAEYDLLVAWQEEFKKIKTGNQVCNINIFGREFNIWDFGYRNSITHEIEYDAPRFYTLEEWWEKNVKK